jgi:four helix bundle protein
MNKSTFDLEERTAKFSTGIIDFCKHLQETTINKPLINQIIRSATSVGANYCEANGASSKLDFRNKIYICKKEAKETKYWLRMIATSNPETKEKAKELWKEAQELTLIFSKIVLTLKS